MIVSRALAITLTLSVGNRDRILSATEAKENRTEEYPSPVLCDETFIEKLAMRAHQFVDLVLHHSSLKEVRIHIGPQMHRVDEHELAKIFFCNQPMLDEFMSFFGHLGDVGHVPVADVRAEHGLQLRVQRIALGVEGP